MINQPGADRAGRLTPRERECLRLVDQHLSSKVIARRLGLSRHTVDDHVDKARRKLGAGDRFEAARLLAGIERTPPNASGPDANGMAEPPPADLWSGHDNPPSARSDHDAGRWSPGSSETAGPSPVVRRPVRRNTLSVPARLAAILAIAAVAALAFGALLAGARALQDIALTLVG